VTILTPMALEARAVHRGAPWAAPRRIGIGARRAAEALAACGDAPVLLAGFCGGVDPRLAPGDVVLASEIRHSGGTAPCADPTILASALRRRGLNVATGPILSSPRLVTHRRRRACARTDVLAVDLESAAVAQLSSRGPVAVMRVVLDTAQDELHRPVRAARAAIAAWRSLRAASAAVSDWTTAVGPRELVLASPRASCAGVERAVQVVERALEHREPPVYVRKQIVHNAHVIAELERKGAVFVDEIEDIPPGETVIFSAHGVSPAVRARARERRLDVIDATCPLVAKVHAEARRFSSDGYEIVLVGHEGHEEVEGTVGEAPHSTHVVGAAEEVEHLALENPARVAYLTQTTLAVDDTADVIATLRRRFPTLVGPRSSDICYATQNRQDAVRALAADCDLVLVLGSENSSNSRRLVEVAQRAGAAAALIEDGTDLAPELLSPARRIGITAGASAPESLVAQLVAALSALGRITLSERRVAGEDVHFKLPAEARGGG
jgi:4-hydroxy-3-methylbut-2-en-1-yl diphosphate reductase